MDRVLEQDANAFEPIRKSTLPPRLPAYKVDRRFKKRRTANTPLGINQRRNKHWTW